MFCPKKKGFFPFLYTKLLESLSDEDRAAFAGKTTLEDRIKFVLSLKRLSSSASTAANAADDTNLFKIIRPMFGDKSAAKSEENRAAGNAAFHSANYRQAQILYSISVFTAPQEAEAEVGPDGSPFALALANRSACLQRLASFLLAVSDIDLALASGYPAAKAFKLWERRAECLEQTLDFQEAADSFETALNLLNKSNLAKEKLDAMAVKHEL